MIYGGVGIQAQIERLKRGVDIVVATPGRLLDHLERGSIDLSQIEFLVLDEADRMLDLGFIDAILAIAEELPGEEQTLLFSATYSQGIKDLADELLDQPQRIEVARKKITADAITQVVYPVEKSRKREMLSHLIRKGEWQQVLVFVRTRFGANKLTDELLFDGIKAAALHSNKSQSVRTRTLAEFKRGELRVLVATDVAARGLDIERLPQVVNYDLPQVAEDYVHRIGRTGRAGEAGVAISFLSPEEQSLLKAIEALVKYAIPRQTVADFPAIAVWRGGQKAVKRAAEKTRAKQAKKAGGKAKPAPVKKKPVKAAAKPAAKPARAESKPAPAKAAPTRRKKAASEKPAPKVGRRRERTK
jgi:ATP-dependent RNA helicase RhlE